MPNKGTRVCSLLHQIALLYPTNASPWFKMQSSYLKNSLIKSDIAVFIPQPLRAAGLLLSPIVSGLAGRWLVGGEKFVQGCVSETVRCRKLTLDRDIGWGGGGGGGGMCATSWYDLDLAFDLAVVTLKFKFLSRLYLRNCKVWEVNTWQVHWLGV